MFSLRAAQFSGHERLVLARAVLVDRLGDQFLAGAGLALDQHAGVGRGDALQPLDHVAHLGAVADHALEAEPLVQPPFSSTFGRRSRAASAAFSARPAAGRRSSGFSR